MKTTLRGRVSREVLRQAVGRLGEAVRLLDARIDREVSDVNPTERAVLCDRIERWTTEIRTITQRIPLSKPPSQCPDLGGTLRSGRGGRSLRADRPDW